MWISSYNNLRSVSKPVSLALAVMMMFIPFPSGAGEDPMPCDSPSGELVVQPDKTPGAYTRKRFKVKLKVEGGSLDSKIYYTLDGSKPTTGSCRYRDRRGIVVRRRPHRKTLASRFKDMAVMANSRIRRVRIPDATVIRTMAVDPVTGEESLPQTFSYMPGTDFKSLYGHDVAVLSVTVAPEDLLDYENGILVKGKVYDEWASSNDVDRIMKDQMYWKIIGNYMMSGRKWERTADLELFDNTDDNLITLTREVGIRVKGHLSRIYLQRGFNLYFRGDDGPGPLRYAFFSKNEVQELGALPEVGEWESVALFNGGNETEVSKFRDPLVQTLGEGLELSRQVFRPAVLYLNGEYWGMYYLQEKYSKEYFNHHYGVSPDNVVIMFDGEVDVGHKEDMALYERFLRFSDMDFSDPEVWSIFKSEVDVLSLADWLAVQIYIGNHDVFFPDGRNECLWRTRTSGGEGYSDGKWRWALRDVQFSMGLYGLPRTVPGFDSFSYALLNYPLFSELMECREFRSLMRERFSLVIDAFSPERSIPVMEAILSGTDGMLSDTRKRFNYNKDITSLEQSHARNYLLERPAVAAGWLEKYCSVNE